MLGHHLTPVIYTETTTMTTATATVLTPSTTDAQTTMVAMFDAILDAQRAVRDAAKTAREACTIDGPHPVLETINAAKRAISAAHAACDAVDPRWRPSKATRAAYCIDEGTSAGQLVGAVRLLIPGARKAASAQAKAMIAAHKARI